MPINILQYLSVLYHNNTKTYQLQGKRTKEGVSLQFEKCLIVYLPNLMLFYQKLNCFATNNYFKN